MLVTTLVAAPLLLLVTAFLYRTFTLLYTTDQRLPGTRRPGARTRLLIVLGSGGHTAEMFAMLRGLDTARYTHRSYVVSSGDAFSAARAALFEAGLAAAAGVPPRASPPKLHGEVDAAGSFDVSVVPRARRVHQPLWSTPCSAAACLLAALGVLRRPTTAPPDALVVRGRAVPCAPYAWPDLIVTNGPGTGVVVVLAALAARFAGLQGAHGKMRTVYVESWARVGRLSLSGRLLLRVVDRFIVQWEKLAERTGGRGEYIGVLV